MQKCPVKASKSCLMIRNMAIREQDFAICKILKKGTYSYEKLGNAAQETAKKLK